jgi:pimeloyl-[acyl-carrier protein] synthase
MNPTKTADRFFIEAMSPQSREDPYPLYATYLEYGPILPLGNVGWLGLSHSVVDELLRHRGLSADSSNSSSFAKLQAADPEMAEAARDRRRASILFLDPPDHTRLRSLIARAFTPRIVAKLSADIEAIVGELMADLAPRLRDGETVNLMSAIANPLPVRFICQLLGVPYEDEEKLADWSDLVSLNVDPAVLATPENDRKMARAKAELGDYLEEVIERHRRDPGEDLLSALAMVETAGDEITREELIDLARLLLIAGHLTTTSLIGNGMLALMQHRDQLDLLHSRPELIGSAVDELLRWEPPIQVSMRIAIEPLDVAGVHIEPGETLMLATGAANRDPAMFANPQTLDITRDARRHLSFGGGIHYCLGHTLAKVEGQAAIGALVRQFPTIRLADVVVRRPNYAVRGLERLPVTI